MSHRRRELLDILQSPLLNAELRQGDAEARRALDEAREELRQLDEAEQREAAA